MTLDGDGGAFDNMARSHSMAESILNNAWLEKKELVEAKTIQTLNLLGIDENQIQAVGVVGGSRLEMPITEEGILSFDTINLLTGIFAGDYKEDGKVNVYYPHVRENQLVGKTVMEMTLEEAVMIMKVAAKANEIEPQALKDASIGMVSKFTLFGQEQFDLHANDIGALLARLI